jgi:hypothetical protein
VGCRHKAFDGVVVVEVGIRLARTVLKVVGESVGWLAGAPIYGRRGLTCGDGIITMVSSPSSTNSSSAMRGRYSADRARCLKIRRRKDRSCDFSEPPDDDVENAEESCGSRRKYTMPAVMLCYLLSF